jgi:hypothetical protein
MSSEFLNSLNENIVDVHLLVDVSHNDVSCNDVSCNVVVKSDIITNKQRGRPKKSDSKEKKEKVKKVKLECPMCLELRKKLNDNNHRYTVLISRLKTIVDLN